MIIISCKNHAAINNKLIYCAFNDYISSIEYIDNGYDDILIKQINKFNTSFFNLEKQYHNPIGPAFINYNFEGEIDYESFYKNNVFLKEVFIKN